MRVGIVGVGQMGFPMAERLVTRFSLTFFARHPEVAAKLAALGAEDGKTLDGMAANSDVVVVCVYSDAQVQEVCLGPGGLIAAMRPGSTLVNHTTGNPKTVALLAEAGDPGGVRVLDAALSGGPADISAGRLTLLVGGESTVLDDVRPVLGAYADPIIGVGQLGDGQRVKLVNNALFGAQVALVAEAERVAGQLGVDALTALAAITHCSGDSKVLRMVLGLGSSARADEVAGRFIRKDVAMVKEVAEDAGVDLGLLGSVALSRGGPS